MSHGTESTMPVYKASVEIIQNIRRIAREVLRKLKKQLCLILMELSIVISLGGKVKI